MAGQLARNNAHTKFFPSASGDGFAACISTSVSPGVRLKADIKDFSRSEKADAAGSEVSTPVSGGEMKLRSTVSITFELE